jgi:hypothetical protein
MRIVFSNNKSPDIIHRRIRLSPDRKIFGFVEDNFQASPRWLWGEKPRLTLSIFSNVTAPGPETGNPGAHKNSRNPPGPQIFDFAPPDIQNSPSRFCRPNVAKYDPCSSRRKTGRNSGNYSAFSRIMTSRAGKRGQPEPCTNAECPHTRAFPRTTLGSPYSGTPRHSTVVTHPPEPPL